MTAYQNFSHGISAVSGLGPPELYHRPIYDFHNSQIALEPKPSTHQFQDRFWSGLAGWGAGGGHGVSRVDSGAGNSPAISALGLLAFLFFLNLIQNSLITNRWLLNNTMLTNTNITTTTVNGGTTVTSGRKFLYQKLNDRAGAEFRPIGKERQKRESDKMDVYSTTSDSIPTHPISQSLLNWFQKNLLWKEILGLHKTQAAIFDASNKSGISGTTKGKNPAGWIVISNSCIRLLACKLGRGISLNLGESSGYMIHSIRNYFSLPKYQDLAARWTSRLMGAIVRGSQSNKSCEKLFRNCKRPSL